MIAVCTALEPERQDLAPFGLLQPMIDWLTANGCYRPRTVSARLDLVDMPVVTVTEFARDSNDRLMVDPDSPDTLMRVSSDHPIRVRPPEWWQPPNRTEVGV